MSRLIKVAGALVIVLASGLAAWDEAAAAPYYPSGRPYPGRPPRPVGRMCSESYCVQRAPFVCRGPIGSCGFAQGACIRTAYRRVPCGGTFVQPR